MEETRNQLLLSLMSIRRAGSPTSVKVGMEGCGYHTYSTALHFNSVVGFDFIGSLLYTQSQQFGADVLIRSIYSLFHSDTNVIRLIPK